ncbi:MAG TPA: RimK family alpha-L-glutamate ligase [archaeon]|nr:RimK family alpha-L-glutamate ligase [archaeon]
MKKQLTKSLDEKDLTQLEPSLVIISSKGAKMSTIKSLISEAQKKFSNVLVVPINKIQIQTSEQGVGLFYKGKNLLCYDVIYPRVSSKDFFLAEAVLKAIESSDSYSPVSLKSFQITNHKFYTSQILSNKGLPGVTSTFFISSRRAQMAVSETGYPFVMKLISGFAGKGVVLINNNDQMESILDAVHLFEEFICTQKFIKGKNFDIRCYVIGNLVLVVKRTSKKGDWRANISRGGSAQLINPTPEMISIAQNAAKELGMDICAVDLMQHKNKWVVIEVNFMPGPFMKYLGNTIIHEWLRYLSVKGKKIKKQKNSC